jgi:uncharacterized membrane protein YphA (DoxX/SURF4 family)
VNAAQIARALARLGLSGMFLYAGVLKLLDPAGLAQDVSHYRLLPDAIAPWLALTLPVLEVVTALALLTPRYVRGGAGLCALMLALFAAAMAQAKLRGIDLACGCFGDDSQQVSAAKVALNVGLAILSLWIAWTTRPPGAPTHAAAPPPSAQPS